MVSCNSVLYLSQEDSKTLLTCVIKLGSPRSFSERLTDWLENDIQTIVTMDPNLTTIELRADKIQ